MIGPMLVISKFRWVALSTLLWFSTTASSEILEGLVISVADGDTLTLQVGDRRYRIRLSEIDTPERDQPWGTRQNLPWCPRSKLNAYGLRSQIQINTVVR